MGIKCEDGRSELLLLFVEISFQTDPIVDRLKDSLVSEVNAIEVSNCDGGADIQIAEFSNPLLSRISDSE